MIPACIIFGLVLQHAVAVTPTKANPLSTVPHIQVTPGGGTVAVEKPSLTQSSEDPFTLVRKRAEPESFAAIEVGVDGSVMSAKSKHEDETGQDAKKSARALLSARNEKEDCEEGQIREDFGTHLVVHEYGDKDNIMTEKQCRMLCQKRKKKCKAFDYYEDECRGVSKIGKPRLGENPDGRTFCTMKGADNDDDDDSTSKNDDDDNDNDSTSKNDDDDNDDDSTSKNDDDDNDDDDNDDDSTSKKLSEDCEEGQIREDFVTHLVVDEREPKKMTAIKCWMLCKNNKKCKAFDFNKDECRGVSKIGKPRYGENPDGRTFCIFGKKARYKAKAVTITTSPQPYKPKGAPPLSKDCEEGQIRDDFRTHLVVQKFGDKDNIMTEKQCRKLCKKNKKCKAFDYYEDECRGVSKVGKPRLGENPDGRTFCKM